MARPRVADWRRIVILAAGGVAALALVAHGLPAVRVFGVAAFLAVMAAVQERGRAQWTLTLASLAATVFGLYRLVNTSVPFVWLGTDWLGLQIGRVGGLLTGHPQRVGATFAGLDFLVVTAVLYAAWVVRERPSRARAGLVAGAILAVHLAYLVLLSLAPTILAALPEAPKDEKVWPPRSIWHLSAGVRTLIPWNFPAVAALLHGALAVFLLRRREAGSHAAESGAEPLRGFASSDALFAAAAALAILAPVVGTLSWQRCDLAGRKIVVYEKGFLNWFKPEFGGMYGRLGIGMYGMMPAYCEALGARCLISPELSERDLSDADVLILMFPDEKWKPGQLERIWSFVRRGGSLAVFGDHTQVVKGMDENAFNEVLKPTGMHVAFDSATYAVGGWLQSYETLTHPTSAGVRDLRNDLGVVIGASVDVRFPARPLIIGRWGWNDAGDVAATTHALMGNDKYDSGEKLGDVVLAAEQDFGKGRIIAFGDTSSMTNGIMLAAYRYTSRLLAYLASKPSGPQAPWRGAALLVVAYALAAALWRRPDHWRTLGAALLLAVSLVACERISVQTSLILPDGRKPAPALNNLAYVSASHVESYSSESWRPDGTMGLMLTLMRNGYLTLDLMDLTKERLERAGLLVLIAPNRPFSGAEREAIHEFVEGGGILIVTVGYEDVEASRDLLADFGFYIGEQPPGLAGEEREPAPLGFFKAPYVQVRQGASIYTAYVRFYAAWPVGCIASDARPIAYGRGTVPVALGRDVGKGKVVVVGDTCFATNKNLEMESGQAFDGMRENPDFWRWFLARLRGLPDWVPPNPQPVLPAPPAAGVPK